METTNTTLSASLEEAYRKACEVDSTADTTEFVPKFREISGQCSHVTEFGVRNGTSTWGFLAGHPTELHSYDVIRSTVIDDIERIAKENNIHFVFHLENVLEVEIAETEMLFIDTQHTYKQVVGELAKHAGKVKKWILLHDTTLFGTTGDDGGAGLNQGIEEFLNTHPEWKLKEKIESKWGLTILERV